MPELRLPEFRNDEGWEVFRLGELCDLYQAETISSSNFNPDGEHLVYGAGGIVGRLNRFNHAEEEVIVSCRGNCGEVHLTKPRSWITGNSMVVVPEDERIVKHFLYYLLKAADLQSIISGSAQPQITRQGFSPFLIAFPGLIEQQKIASCLSTLDELIGTESQKLDALKAHKKGLMQQLFPREGETLPRLRFPEFQTAPAWLRMPLGELMPITSSKRVHESEWSADGVDFYRARELVALNNGDAITPLHISEELYRVNIGLSGEIRSGHLLVTGVGSIGVPYLVKTEDRFYFKDGNIIWLKNDQSELIGELLLCLYQTDHVQSQIRKMADVGTVATYTIDNARKTVVAFPESKLEQQRIASCVSAINDIVTTQSQKLQALQAHKQGLMQQLFPSLVATEA